MNSTNNDKKEWFNEWFDSPYYHILYENRDNNEAKIFIKNLADYFGFKKGEKVLDLACGKGRHSVNLNKLGLDVIGLDLSGHNIAFAKQFENRSLHFFKHDMREPYDVCCFEYVLNLFTSFGYFDTSEENEKAVIAAEMALKPGGHFLIDFLNPYKVIHHLIPEEIKTAGGIGFHLKRYVKDGYIIKDIRFEDKGRQYHFREKVKAIRRVEFLEYFKMAHLDLIDIFGNYELDSYVKDVSERMIFVLNKNS